MIFGELISIKGIRAAIGMFTVLEILTVWLIETKSKTIAPRKSINLLLGVKVGKILLTILFVAVYALVVKVEQQRFVMVFIVTYLIYLFSDTIYLTHREKKLKALRTNQSNPVENE